MHSVDTDASFVYNENGLRVQKTVNGVVTKYTLHGKNVVHMTQGSNELHFFYDAQNKPAIVVYNGTPYSYVKNLQGDIVAILDSNKNVVVSYVYDAWGRPISCSGTMASTLGKINPFRYRGYVYDEETELYYLRSRYYNAVQCRFSNADTVLGRQCGLLSSNQYVYCENNATNNLDAFGYSPSKASFSVCAIFDGGGAQVESQDEAPPPATERQMEVLNKQLKGRLRPYYSWGFTIISAYQTDVEDVLSVHIQYDYLYLELHDVHLEVRLQTYEHKTLWGWFCDFLGACGILSNGMVPEYWGQSSINAMQTAGMFSDAFGLINWDTSYSTYDISTVRVISDEIVQ